jgi:hypothetical protein
LLEFLSAERLNFATPPGLNLWTFNLIGVELWKMQKQKDQSQKSLHKFRFVSGVEIGVYPSC